MSLAAAQLRGGQPLLSELTALQGSGISGGTGGGSALARVAGSTVAEGLKGVGRSIKQAAPEAAEQ